MFALVGVIRGSSPAEPAPGLVLEFTTTGLLPGAGREAKPSVVRQRITVDATGTRILYEETPEGARETRRVILRADGPKPVVWELIGIDGYKEHDGDLNRVQSERDLIEANQVLSANSLPRKDREAFFRENCGLLPNNERVVKVVRSAAQPFLGHDCERVLLTENCLTILEGDVARMPLVQGGFFQLYRRLGAFSDKVLAELGKIDGVLLRGKVTVVTALRPHQFEIEATKITVQPVASALFEVAGRRKLEDPVEVACAVCGKVLDPGNKTTTSLVPLPSGKVIPSCSNERCLKALQKQYLSTGGAQPAVKPPPPPGAGAK